MPFFHFHIIILYNIYILIYTCVQNLGSCSLCGYIAVEQHLLHEQNSAIFVGESDPGKGESDPGIVLKNSTSLLWGKRIQDRFIHPSNSSHNSNGKINSSPLQNDGLKTTFFFWHGNFSGLC